MPAIDDVSLVRNGNFMFVRNRNRSQRIQATIRVDSSVNTGSYPQQIVRTVQPGGDIEAGTINAGGGQILAYRILGARYMDPRAKVSSKKVGKKKSAKKKPAKKKSAKKVPKKAKRAKRAAGKQAPNRKDPRSTGAVATPRGYHDVRARTNGARAMLGDKPVSMWLVANAFSAVDAAKRIAAPSVRPAAAAVADDASVAPPPIPGVFPCTQGDRLHCEYTIANTIVAEAVLYLAPDENGDGVGDRMDTIGHSHSPQVSGTTARLSAGWSYLVWDFHPANQNTWTATLNISVNGGPAFVFGEASDNEASHHQAGMLIWAEPNA